MAVLLNNSGLQHYANKMCLAEDRRVGDKPLPSALADIDATIDEMKILFEAEYGSALDMKLENNENIFNVGQGGEIDRRSEVENSFTDIEISGNSMVNRWVGTPDSNILQNPSDRFEENSINGYLSFVANNDGIFNIFVNGELLKVNTTYTVVMDVSKNSLSDSDALYFYAGVGCTLSNSLDYEPRETGVKVSKLVIDSDVSFFPFDSIFKIGDLDSKKIGGEFVFRIQILEGDWTDKPLPNYFEGLQSIGRNNPNLFKPLDWTKGKSLDSNGVEYDRPNDQITDFKKVCASVDYIFTSDTAMATKYIFQYDKDKNFISRASANGTNPLNFRTSPITKYIRGMLLSSSDTTIFYCRKRESEHYEGYRISILSTGKNLVQNLKLLKGHNTSPPYLPTAENAIYRTAPYIKLNKGTYSIYCTNKDVYIRIMYDAKNNKTLGEVNGYKKTFTLTDEALLTMYMRDKASSSTLWTLGETTKEIGLTIVKDEAYDENEVLVSYLDKKEISLNEPLRGLPNGIKDTIELVNGDWKIIRRCGEVVLDGSEDWIFRTKPPANESLALYHLVTDIGNSNCYICDNFSYLGKVSIADTEIKQEGIARYTGVNHFYMSIKKTRLTQSSANGLKQWLSQNPTRVIHELTTPIIEDISPITLQCWKNGTISIDEVLPVASTHTVALNKPSQIKRNIEELTTLRNKVKSLEEKYDQIALEQSHQLSLINHSYELDYNI